MIATFSFNYRVRIKFLVFFGNWFIQKKYSKLRHCIDICALRQRGRNLKVESFYRLKIQFSLSIIMRHMPIIVCRDNTQTEFIFQVYRIVSNVFMNFSTENNDSHYKLHEKKRFHFPFAQTHVFDTKVFRTPDEEEKKEPASLTNRKNTHVAFAWHSKLFSFCFSPLSLTQTYQNSKS